LLTVWTNFVVVAEGGIIAVVVVGVSGVVVVVVTFPPQFSFSCASFFRAFVHLDVVVAVVIVVAVVDV